MTTYTDLSPRTNTAIEAMFLRQAQEVRVLQHTCLMKSLPKNKTQTLTFRRANVLEAQTTPLVEGVTPTASAFTITDVAVTIRQYGQVIDFTDVIEDTHEDPIVREMSKQLGHNIGRTMEALDWAVVRGGSSVSYANGSARTDVNTPISLAKLRGAGRTLKRQKAEYIREVIKPGPNIGTRAIEPSWIVVAHTDLDSDIRNLPGFIPTASYPGGKALICDEEIGSVERYRFVLSPDLDVLEDAGGTYNGSGTSMVTTTGTSADVYPMVVFGKDAWASVALEMSTGSVVPSVIRPSKTISDPLAQRGAAGWKTWHAAVRLNEAWMTRIEVAATAL